MTDCKYPPAHSVGDYHNCGCKEEFKAMTKVKISLFADLVGDASKVRSEWVAALAEFGVEAIFVVRGEEDLNPIGEPYRVGHLLYRSLSDVLYGLLGDTYGSPEMEALLDKYAPATSGAGFLANPGFFEIDD